MCFNVTTRGQRPPELPQVPEEPDIVLASREASRLERERAKKRKGFASTILTSPLGLTNESDIFRRALLESNVK